MGTDIGDEEMQLSRQYFLYKLLKVVFLPSMTSVGKNSCMSSFSVPTIFLWPRLLCQMPDAMQNSLVPPSGQNRNFLLD